MRESCPFVGIRCESHEVISVNVEKIEIWKKNFVKVIIEKATWCMIRNYISSF